MTGIKWYFKTNWIVVAFLSVGPLALPLVWFHPTYSRNKKIIVTIIIIVLSYLLGVWVTNSLRSISKYYETLLQGNI